MDDDEERDWWDVLVKLGMPLLYILGITAGIVGAICQGVITEYWSNLEPGNCFLYAKVCVFSVTYLPYSSVPPVGSVLGDVSCVFFASSLWTLLDVDQRLQRR